MTGTIVDRLFTASIMIIIDTKGDTIDIKEGMRSSANTVDIIGNLAARV